MQGINCVKNEIHNTLAQLRLTSAKTRGDEAHSVKLAFKRLFETLSSPAHDSLLHLDTRTWFAPFLHIVSSNFTPELTLTALQSIHKFLLYGHIDRDAPHVVEALAILSQTISAWTNAHATNEVVYMKIIEIMLETLRCSAGFLLTNDCVCAMFEEVFHIRSRRGTSQLLAKYAENIIMQMIMALFARINDISANALSHTGFPRAARSLSASSRPDVPTLSHSHSPALPMSHAPGSESGDAERGSFVGSGDNAGAIGMVHSSDTARTRADSSTSAESDFDEPVGSADTKPYDVSALFRVFRFVTGLCNPGDPKNDLATREFGLRMINVALETAGPSLGSHPLLLAVVQDDLCKHLLQNSHTAHLPLLSLSLRLVFDLFCALKRHLRLQLEVFFTSIHLRIGESKSASADQRELVFESLLEFCHEPSLIIGLYQNYDCEVGSRDLFEDLVKFLSCYALPPTGTSMQSINLLALEALLAILESMDKRFSVMNGQLLADSREDELHPASMATADLADVLRRRQEKKKLEIAAQRFNAEGKGAFKFIQSLKLLPDPLTCDVVARFLLDTPNLDKGQIGSFLGSEKKFNEEVLQCYVALFDFHQLKIDDALRKFLDAFMLPKEAQQISRVIEAFARQYFSHSSGQLANGDAAFILAFSVIMLNTDAHNPLVAKKMTVDEFIRNNRGINDGKDLPREYLQELYESITQNEIRIMSNGVATDASSQQQQQWQRLLEKARTSGDFETTESHAQGREMFALMWESLFHLFQRALISDSDPDEAGISELEEPELANGPLPTHLSSSPSVSSSFATVSLPSSSSVAVPQTEANNPAGNREKLIIKVTEGYRICARICAVYNLHDVLNNMVIAMCKQLCSLYAECLRSAKSYIQTSAQAGKSSHTLTTQWCKSVFGRSRPTQRITRLLFELVSVHGERHLLEAWSNVLQSILWLRHLYLLPNSLLELDDFVSIDGRPLPSLRPHGAGVSLPLSSSSRLAGQSALSTAGPAASVAASAPAEKAEKRSTISVLSSALLSIWSQAQDEEDEMSLQQKALEDHVRHSAVELVRQSEVHSLFASTKQFSPSVLSHFLSSLLLLCTISWRPGSLPIPPYLIDSVGIEILDQESACFCLERIWDLFEKNISVSKARSQLIWPPICAHFEWILTLLIPPASPAPSADAPSVTFSPPRPAAALPPPSFFIERAIVTLFRIVTRLVHKGEFVDDALRICALLADVDESILVACGPRVLAGLHGLLRQCETSNLTSEAHWHSIFSILLRFNSLVPFGAQAFETFTYVISHLICKQNFLPALNALMNYAELELLSAPPPPPPAAVPAVAPSRGYFFSSAPAPQPIQPVTPPPSQHATSNQIISALIQLHSKLQSFQAPPPTKAFEGAVSSSPVPAPASATASAGTSISVVIGGERRRVDVTGLWLLSLSAFAKLCRSPRADVAAAALNAMERALLAESIALAVDSPQAWKRCFEMLLMPLLVDLAEAAAAPDASASASACPSTARATSAESKLDSTDMRLRVGSLLFRVLLHQLSCISALPDFHIFWLKFVGFLERCMKHKTDDRLALHFIESLKNVLLVMNATGVFTRASERSGQDLNALTWTVIGTFRPDLKAQLEDAMAQFLTPMPINAESSATALP